MQAVSADNICENDFVQAATDARISYPCYKSLDEFIDVARLRSLDAYMAEKIRHHIETEREDYFLNLYRLDAETPYKPGVREIWLSRTREGLTPAHLEMVDRSEFWEPTAAAREFAELMDFIDTLPFESRGRVMIFYDDAGAKVPAHRDHLETDVCHEFVWFRTSLQKPFYVLNQTTGDKKYVVSYSAWFDSVNQYHGSDACAGLNFSLRVDGCFKNEFRELIPRPDFNAASTPALWACLSGENG